MESILEDQGGVDEFEPQPGQDHRGALWPGTPERHDQPGAGGGGGLDLPEVEVPGSPGKHRRDLSRTAMPQAPCPLYHHKQLPLSPQKGDTGSPGKRAGTSKSHWKEGRTALNALTRVKSRNRSIRDQENDWKCQVRGTEAAKIQRVLKERQLDAEKQAIRDSAAPKLPEGPPPPISSAPAELKTHAAQLGFDIEALPFRQLAEALPGLIAVRERNSFLDSLLRLIQDSILSERVCICFVDRQEGQLPLVRRIEAGGPYGTPWQKLDPRPRGEHHLSGLSQAISGESICYTTDTPEGQELFQAFRDELELPVGFRTHAVLQVPMRKASGEVFAVIEARNKRTGLGFPFSSDDMEMAELLATLGATQILDIDHDHDAKVRLTRFETLQQTSLDMFWELDCRAAADHARRGAQAMLRAKSASLFVLDKERQVLRRLDNDYSSGSNRDKAEEFLALREKKLPETSLTQGIAGHVAQFGALVNIEDAHGDTRYDPAVDRTEGTLIERDAYEKRAILTVPLLLKGEHIGEGMTCTGVLQITNRADELPFDAQDEAAARMIATMAARGLKNATLFETRQRQMAALEKTNQLQAALLSCSLAVAPPSESSTMQEVVRELCKEVVRLVPCSGIRVELLVGCQMWIITHPHPDGVSPGSDEEAWQTPDDPAGIHSNIVPGQGLTGQAVQKAASMRSNQITAEAKYERDLDSASSIHPKNTILVPLVPPECMNLDAVQLRDRFRLPKHGAVLTPNGPVFGLVQLVNKLHGEEFLPMDTDAVEGLAKLAAVHLLRAASRQPGYAGAPLLQRKKSVAGLLSGIETPHASPSPTKPAGTKL